MGVICNYCGIKNHFERMCQKVFGQKKSKSKVKSSRTVRVVNYETDHESDHEQETSRDSNKYSSRISNTNPCKVHRHNI